MHMSACSCVGGCAHAYICRWITEINLECHPLGCCPHWFLEARPFTGLGTCQIRLCWPIKSKHQPVSISPSLNSQHVLLRPAFHVGSGDGIQVRMPCGKYLGTELSSQTVLLIFF